MEMDANNQQSAVAESQVNALLGPDAGPFEALVSQLMSARNEDRGQAEQLFNLCRDKQLDIFLLKLMFTVRAAAASDIRAMAAVLLRKQLGSWSQLNVQTKGSIKEQILFCIQQEENQSVLKKLCDTVAEVAGNVVEDAPWAELLPFLFQCVNSNVNRLKVSALLIFGQLAQHMGPQLQPHLSTLHALFQQTLSPSMPNDVRSASLRAVAYFVQTLESAKDRNIFQDLLPAMMQTVTQALEMHEEATAQDALEMLIEIAGSEPQFLRKQLVEVVGSILQIAEAEGLEESTQHLAVEFLISLTEARERAPGMMRKLPHFIGRIFAVLMKMLTDIEDDPAWHSAEAEYEDAGETSNYEMAQECLDRLAISMGGSSVLSAASELLPVYVADQDWRKRHAALIALAQIAEGCAKIMTNISNLQPVVNMVLNAFQDPQPKVRWAAINAIGQLSTDLGPDLQKHFHESVLPALIKAMDDFQNARVQAHAAAAILNFSESCGPELLSPYLDGVVAKLLTLLQSGKRMVQEGALTALASVADSSKVNFQVYYDSVMPFLKAILLNATDKPNRMLRAKAIECLSLVGMAVGKEKFGQDAKQVMEVLITLQGSHLDDDDPTTSYMLQAWARLCKCLGQDFLPYMSIVMPPLLHSAQLKPDVTITDADDSDDDIDSDDESVETITIGDKRIGIRTSFLEEKATACNMLCCYADELKEGFYPWIDQVAPVLVPLLKFYFHEEVRKAAISAMPELLKSAKLAIEKGQAQGRDQSYLKQLADYIVPALVEALHKEPEIEVLIDLLDSLNECMKVLGTLVDPGQVRSMVDEFKQVLTASDTRKKERLERSRTEDFDEEENEIVQEENEQEEEVFEQFGECLGTLLKTFKSSFLTLFEELLPFITPMLAKDRSPEDRRIAICIFDDVAEQCQGAAAKYYDIFLPYVLDAATDANNDVRQAAVYGIGVCAEFGGSNFKPLVGEALEKLKLVISQPSAFQSENAMATDNAVSALGKICEFHRDVIDATQVVPAWLSCLPIRADLVEAKVVHEQLCSLMERSDPILLGSNSQYLPKIIAVFAEVVSSGNDLATSETIGRIANILRHIQQTMPAPALASTWSSLQPQQQAALQSILS
ncbi:hypothetical protein KP509_06G064500 [Ceratopteris richardii]|uniref:TOG domain-containing protein n=1 Tax=Ceratopteris richardii TaxID=49495 RepID=A0A8T2UNF7_CERRI|nr:hypothetical protein KP509_06G064500 [Ceratopteris richardii]KAH7435427.1 hypothetical protein KP509_06G064500 [Ceratopteris richardii]